MVDREIGDKMVLQLLLCLLLVIQVRSSPTTGMIYCYGELYVYADGQQILNSNTAYPTASFQVSDNVQVLGVSCRKAGSNGRIQMTLSNGIKTDHSWTCSPQFEENWFSPEFNDSAWQEATVSLYPVTMFPVFGARTWIWTDNTTDDFAYCRKMLKTENQEPQCKCEDVQQEVTDLKAEVALIQSEVTALKDLVNALQLNLDNPADDGNGNIGEGDIFG
ncbi:hypothetical protein LOTGIDRAFT_172356 [Lottia gigantea]|uniref:Uncharacterized protein n=1 Tax=Lottia gigantea TaxID=225164 RepID=V4B6U7_LOTGI|nr:hypothetical protein LOTGIDRAFT_172356 [Lottia gigantea]ESP01802.1 hypothetical protein LOTGIDRAFT_172356 [Lottia gigantea]